jgi:peptidoglycan/xylan/chitin deacetylase (PgdA/CDA1 family)
MVEPCFDLSVTRVTPRQFERQIHRALDLGYMFQSLSQALLCESVGNKSLVLTFDDAYASVYHHAFAFLQRLGIQATVFVVAGYVGRMDTWDVNFGNICFRHMDWGQLRELADTGWEIGSHTMTHRDLTRLSAAELTNEIVDSKALLESKFEKSVDIVSYPFGNTNSAVADACIRAGYRLGVVMGRRYAGVPAGMAVQRLGIYLFDTPWLFQQKILAKNIKIFNFIQRFIDFCSDGTVLVRQGWRTNH